LTRSTCPPRPPNHAARAGPGHCPRDPPAFTAGGRGTGARAGRRGEERSMGQGRRSSHAAARSAATGLRVPFPGACHQRHAQAEQGAPPHPNRPPPRRRWPRHPLTVSLTGGGWCALRDVP
jgi:hypothetical protein